MVIYKDSSDWKRHYDDWAKFLATAKWDKDNVTKTQHEYRVKIFDRLMKDYEANNKWLKECVTTLILLGR